MSVVVSMEELGPCAIRLKVEVPAPAVEAETARVVANVSKKASVPGFRKGKVPKSLILQRYRGEIDQGLIDRLVPRYWNQAAAEKEITALLQPEFEVESLELGEAFVFTATVEVNPTFELGSITDFDLPELETEPHSETVEKAIADLRFQAGSWQDVDRPAANGDQVEGVIQVVSDDEPGPEQPIRIEVGDTNVWEELSLAVVGATKDREVTFERTLEEEEKTFRVKVETVRERELPELDDEFAKGLGDFESFSALEEQVTKQLRSNLEAEHSRQKEAAVLDQLRQRHPFDLPEGVVGQEVEGLLREYAESLVHRGVDIENAGIDWQEMAEKLRPQAERRVASRILLDAVAEKEEIEVEEAEFEATLAAIARSEKKSAGAIRQALDRSGRLGRLRGDLLREKALKHLLGEETETPTEP